jgi:hypothetical protein
MYSTINFAKVVPWHTFISALPRVARHASVDMRFEYILKSFVTCHMSQFTKTNRILTNST